MSEPTIEGINVSLESTMKARKSTTARGYGAHHVALRKQWGVVVRHGDAYCARCGRHIEPDEPWDLGHDDHDRTKYQGPEHPKCNRGAYNKKKVERSSRIW